MKHYLHFVLGHGVNGLLGHVDTANLAFKHVRFDILLLQGSQTVSTQASVTYTRQTGSLRHISAQTFS